MPAMPDLDRRHALLLASAFALWPALASAVDKRLVGAPGPLNTVDRRDLIGTYAWPRNWPATRGRRMAVVGADLCV